MIHQVTRTIPYILCLVGLSVANAKAAPPAKGETVITIEGHAPGTNGNAMEQAKQDALRKAVEQACGTFISSQTKIENYAAVYDKAMSFAGGYITKNYGRPEKGLHALQVEINRALYMDEGTFEKTQGFEGLKDDLERMAQALMGAVCGLAIPRVAAE